MDRQGGQDRGALTAERGRGDRPPERFEPLTMGTFGGQPLADLLARYLALEPRLHHDQREGPDLLAQAGTPGPGARAVAGVSPEAVSQSGSATTGRTSGGLPADLGTAGRPPASYGPLG